MIDWEGYEELVNQKLAAARAHTAQQEQLAQLKRTHVRFTWLARLLHRRRPAKESAEPPPVRPAFR